MTQKEFDLEISRIMRRLQTLKAAKSGDIQLKRVPVKRHYVEGFWVRRHDRMIAPRRPQKIAMKRAA